MLTCSQQIDSKIFACMKHIRPAPRDHHRRAEADRRCLPPVRPRRGAPADASPGMLQNLVTLETFSVRGGLIHHVEAAPFVTIPCGLGKRLDARGEKVKV
jgi:hypothetical protein